MTGRDYRRRPGKLRTTPPFRPHAKGGHARRSGYVPPQTGQEGSGSREIS
jgi:hypothetical protein